MDIYISTNSFNVYDDYLKKGRKMTVPITPVQKPASIKAYTPAQEKAAFDALEKLKASAVPWYEQSAITDALVKQIVEAVLQAAFSVKS